MFLLVSVILLTRGGVCLSACWDTPPRSTEADTPLGADPTPPQEQTPPLGADTPPGSRHPTRLADSGIRSMSGRYASYWNAFLFSFSIHKSKNRKPNVVVYFLLSVWIECAFQMLGRVDCLSQEWDPLVGPYTEACVHHKPNTSILSTRAMKQTHFCFSTKQQRRGISTE